MGNRQCGEERPWGELSMGRQVLTPHNVVIRSLNMSFVMISRLSPAKDVFRRLLGVYTDRLFFNLRFL